MSTNSLRLGRQKSSANTKLLSKLLNWLKSPLCLRLLAFAAAFAFAAYWAYCRFPTYWDVPNFYAEDGNIFARNIIDHGFLGGLLTPFNGYFIFGVYLLEWLAFVLNHVFLGGSLLDLPKALGLASYLFWGLLCSLPLALFWNDVKRKTGLVLITLSMAFLPLPAFNYAVFTVGNAKFAFLYIAFLLLVKRWRLPPNSRWVYALDAGIVVCAFTNATTYLLLPLMLLPYWPGRKKLKLSYLRTLLRQPSFRSLLIAYGLAGLQIVYIVLHGGVDELKGYMQEPYQMSRTIEIFLQRTLLYPFDHAFATKLNDVVVVLMAIGLVGVLWKIARREDRRILLLGLFTSLAATALFVSQRTGVSEFYKGYISSGTDHFFYTQNLIMLFTVLYIVIRRLDTIANVRLRLLGFVIVCLVPLSALDNNDIGLNAQMNRQTGSFRYGAQQACQHTNKDPLQVPVYPVGVFHFSLDRNYCKSLSSYIPDRQPLQLEPYGHYITIPEARTTQTFKARYKHLAGISIFLSTFNSHVNSSYRLVLMDATCKHQLRNTPFNGITAADGAYFDVRFKPIANSLNKTYCFTIEPVALEPGKPPLAIQFSRPDIYLEGAATTNDTILHEDVVFDVLYRPE